MNEQDPPDDPRQHQTELDRLAEDWITLWQTEIAAMAADREAAEAWAGAAQFWAAMGAGMGAGWMRMATKGFAHDTPAWPAPAATPPDPGRQPGPGGAEPDARLDARLAELERRLAAIERGPGGKPADRRGPRRRKPPA